MVSPENPLKYIPYKKKAVIHLDIFLHKGDFRHLKTSPPLRLQQGGLLLFVLLL
jgi:hypothetical protein